MKKTKGKQKETSTLLQWNCRGIRNKKGELQLYVDILDQKRDVIALQKTNGRVKLEGYVTYTDPSEKGTAILVRSNMAATQHVTAQRGCEHTLIEIHRSRVGGEKNIFVLNECCRPFNRVIDFEGTILDCITEARIRPILVLGNLNAARTRWGYKYSSKRGNQLVKAIEDHDMEVVNEPVVPTRTGTSTVRDTTPNLTLVRNNHDVTWRNTGRILAQITTSFVSPSGRPASRRNWAKTTLQTRTGYVEAHTVKARTRTKTPRRMRRGPRRNACLSRNLHGRLLRLCRFSS